MNYQVITRPKLSRNKYGEVPNKGTVGGSNSLFTPTSNAYVENAGKKADEIQDFQGSTSTEDGIHGLVPAPKTNSNMLNGMNDNVKFLKGTGGWVDIPISRYTSENANKDGIDFTGNLHVTNNVSVDNTLTAHNLEVTGLAHFWSLVIDEVKSVGGQLIVSPANMDVDLVQNTTYSIESSNPFYSLFHGAGVNSVNVVRCLQKRTDGSKSNINQWTKGDFAICKTFNVGAGTSTNVSNKYYYTPVFNVGTVTVDGTDYNFIDLLKSWVISGTTYNIGSSISGVKMGDGAMTADIGDALVQLGNYNDADRQNAIIISAYNPIDTSLEAPCIAQYVGINSFIDLKNFKYTWLASNSNEIRGNLKLANGTTVVSITDGLTSTVSSQGQSINTLNSTVSNQGQSINTLNSTVSSQGQSISSLNTSVGNLNTAVSNQGNAINNLNSTVTTHTTQISQKADSITLAGYINDMESVGIHLDGANSVLNLVGSLTVKQNGIGDVDTISVYDDNEDKRVEISPAEIPAKSDIDNLNSKTKSINNTVAFSFTTGNSHILRYETNFGAMYAGDTFNFKGMIATGSRTSTDGTVSFSDSHATIRIYVDDVLKITQPVTISSAVVHSDNSFIIALADTAITTGLDTSGTVKVAISITCNVSGGTYAGRSTIVGWAEINSTQDQPTYMHIGANGFYYISGAGKYLYSGASGFELKYNNDTIAVDSKGIKIQKDIQVVTGNATANREIVHCQYNGSNYTLTLPSPSNFGYGRSIEIFGYQGLAINFSGGMVIGTIKDNTGTTNYYLLPNFTLGNETNISSYPNTVKSYGYLRVVALTDGWHIAQTII